MPMGMPLIPGSPSANTGICPHPSLNINFCRWSMESDGRTVTIPVFIIRLMGKLLILWLSARSTARRVSSPTTCLLSGSNTGYPSYPKRRITSAASATVTVGCTVCTPNDINSATRANGFTACGSMRKMSAITAVSDFPATRAAAARLCPPPPNAFATTATSTLSPALRATICTSRCICTSINSAAGVSASRRRWAIPEISSSKSSGATAPVMATDWPANSCQVTAVNKASYSAYCLSVSGRFKKRRATASTAP